MGKNRNTSDYLRRQTKARETRKKFLIVCEGEKTEVNYFKAFTVPKKIEFMVKGEGKNSLSLVNKPASTRPTNPNRSSSKVTHQM